MISAGGGPVKSFRDKYVRFKMWNFERLGMDTEVACYGVLRFHRDGLESIQLERPPFWGMKRWKLLGIRLVPASPLG